MHHSSPVKLISTCFALAAFSVAIVAGLAADNSGTQILTTAIISMIGCQVLGLILGSVAQRAIDEHIDRYQKSHPIPHPHTREGPETTVENETGDSHVHKAA